MEVLKSAEDIKLKTYAEVLDRYSKSIAQISDIGLLTFKEMLENHRRAGFYLAVGTEEATLKAEELLEDLPENFHALEEDFYKCSSILKVIAFQLRSLV